MIILNKKETFSRFNYIDDCLPSQCENGATCKDEINDYTCECADGYTDKNCSTNIDDCLPDPCENGATCQDGINDYICNCVPGYMDKNCSTNINDCETQPCDNGATCIDEVGDYECICSPGYTDKNCSTDIDECSTFPCKNNGTCFDLVSDFECLCRDGFTSKTCRPGKLGDDCSARPGVCVNIPFAECNDTMCVCKTGFESRIENNGACSRVDCLSVPKVDFGNISLQNENDTKYGSIANVNCNQGFEPSEPTITCRTDKTWTIPACNRKNCSAVVAPDKGSIVKHNGSYFESVVTFTCNPGYMLVGNTSIICTHYGLWSSDLPFCISKVSIGEACENNDICRTSGAKCVGGICSCKTGIHNQAFDVCDAMFLYPHGVGKGDQVMNQTDDSCSLPIRFSYGIPVFEHAYTTAFVCTNGLITFNIKYSNPVPGRNISLYENRTLVAPFYASTDLQTSGAVYYRYYDVLHNAEQFQNDDIKHVESMVMKLGSKATFSAKFILFATWDKMRPFQDIFNKTNEATFQAVLVTDGTDTYTLFIYGYKSMHWTIPNTNELKTSPDIWIGYTALGKYSFTNVNSFKITALTMDSNTLTKGISGLLFSPLTTAGTRQPNAAVKCIDWFNENKDMKSLFHDISERRMPDCPCNLDSLSFDPWYWPAEGKENNNSALYTVEVLPSDWFGYSGKSCIYDKATGLWTDEIPKAGGFYIYHPVNSSKNHVIHDIEPKQFCCEQSSLCRLYYELHPVGNCYTQTWFETGISWGDPHFVTLDKKSFTFNGLGEYYLIKLRAKNTIFDLQTRTDRAVRKDATLSYATIFKAFAAKDHTNASFQAELNNQKDGLILYANGADLSLLYNRKTQNSFKYKSDENNLDIIRKNDTLVVFFPNIGISLNVSVGVQMLSIGVTVPKKYQNKTKGLLGNFDGDPDNDLFTPNGTVLAGDSDETEIFIYGQTWQINENSSVFNYGEGLGTADYSSATYIPKFLVDAERENKTKVEEARRICGGDQNVQCVFDYVFTDDENVAKHTKTTKKTADEASEEIGKRIPTLGGCDVLYITKGEEVTCTLKIKDDEDELNFHFIDNSVGASFNTEERQIIYTQGNDLPVNISISAVNNDNKTSTPFRVSVRLCTGCNGHGICTDNIRNDPKETEYFKYMECECEPQYQGLDCEEEYNGCAANPCSLGRECTKLSAAEQITFNKTHLCGECPDGFVDAGDAGDKCKDIDECVEQPVFCQHVCGNTEGSFQCICNHGYRARSGESNNCYDINECDEASHNCTQECINTDGGFNCSCKEGFEFNATTWTCTKADVNVCEETDIDCTETSGCTVNENSDPVCFCETGFKLTENGTSCEDIDECESNVCPQRCNNNIGSFSCSCLSGFKVRDKTTCQECEFPFWGNNCENECKCTGQGSLYCDTVYGCVCKEGWYGDTCDDDKDECDEQADPCKDVRKQCINIPGGYTCTCRSGFVEETDQCIDIDECSSPLLHDCTQTCLNTVGGFTCGCYSGFTPYDSKYCQDIDECALRQHGCEQKCQNLPGLYNCYCYFGYILNDDRRTCTKVSDPCKMELNLTCSHFCVLSIDSAECKCQEGYILTSDKQSCLDVDECSNEELNLCSDNAECINIEGSYFCDCPKGSRLENDGRTCSECDQYHYGEDCSEVCSCLNGYCDPISGCVCDPGWVGQNCDKDFDECSGTICKASKKECVNTPGSFLCRCKSGYRIENSSCTDVNECSDVNQNVCDQICTNTDGSYACSCETGFSFHNGKCRDLDECAGISKCDHTCDNTVGSYRCSCRDGFRLDTTNRQSCIPKNKCNETEENECSKRNAECLIMNGKFDCSCQKGFAINNNTDTCEDTKECSEKPKPCDQLCFEKDGGFSCACDQGSYLLQDGISCKECEKWSFGEDCQFACACSLYNTRSCDPVNGTCDCLDGWKGETCNEDINECDLVSFNECPDNSECVNEEGSFSCKCYIGFLKTADGDCEICDRQWFGEDCSSLCSCQLENTDRCNNIDGKCTCVTGWSGENCTEDVDECEQHFDICSVKKHTLCRNTLGSYKCECTEGYFSQDNVCRDKNECLDGTAECLQECINTDGDYICKCFVGHHGYWNECEECSNNMYGENCTGTCQCNTTNALNRLQSCDIRFGHCLCKPEWTGDTCETDVNECLNDMICAKKHHSDCTNLPGTYNCDCLRGFKEEDSSCIAKEITTIPPASGDSTKVDLLIRLDVHLPRHINLRTSVGYEIVEQTVIRAILSFFRQYTLDMLSLVMNDISRGSIIVNFTIIYSPSNTDLRISLANAVVDLSTGSSMEYNGQFVATALTGPFDNNSNVCDIYTKVRGPCPPASECFIQDSLPTCREILVLDNFSLIFGLGAGACLFILMLMIFALVIRKLREGTQTQKQKGRHIDRLHRDSLYQVPTSLTGNATRNQTRTTTKPQLQRGKREIKPERRQNRENMVWEQASPQDFAFETKQGSLQRFLPRVHSSLLQGPSFPYQVSSRQADQENLDIL